MRRLLLLLVALSLCAAAQQPSWQQAWVSRLQPYVGQVLTLRNFYDGRKLRYDTTGNLHEGGKPGEWSSDALVAIKKIRYEPDKIIFEGERRWAGFEDGQLKATKQARGKVTIEIAVTSEGEGFGEALRHVFLAPGEKIDVPGVCHRWLASLGSGQNSGCDKNNGICRVGGGVTAPRVLAAHDPEYSETARAGKYQGVVVLWLVVGADGKPSDVCVVRPLGMGLDEKAVEAVSQWRFQPATKDGHPVAVQINVEVNFRLY